MFSNSSDLQDEFAYRVIIGNHIHGGGKQEDYKGTFLDVGCGHGFHHNNTLIMEQLGWTGYLIDNNQDLINHNKTIRKAKSICMDVTNPNWDMIKETNIDYLSFDVDDATVIAVEKFPWEKIRFKVITIEHDAYRVGNMARDVIRETMKKHGYFCVAYDVMAAGCHKGTSQPFEDWYIDPNLPAVSYLKYFSVGKRAIDIMCVPR